MDWLYFWSVQDVFLRKSLKIFKLTSIQKRELKFDSLRASKFKGI